MMTLKQLLETTQPGQTLLAHNDPFDYQGKAEITLEGGDVIYWLFNEKTTSIQKVFAAWLAPDTSRGSRKHCVSCSLPLRTVSHV